MTTRRMDAPAKDSHCSYCGAPFPAGLAGWPRTCPACGNTTYRNPLPVAVLIVPVDGGVLLVRRAVTDGRGRLALPGGYVNLGESWQQAAVREAREEMGVAIDHATVGHVRTVSAPDGTLLVFGLAPPQSFDDLPPFVPNAETSERMLANGPTELAFDLHTQVLRDYFAGRGAAHA